MMDGFVYFIVCDASDAVKIGFTDKPPERRLRQLQTGSPFPLRLALVVDGDRSWERAMHEHCSAERLSGEWFTLGGEAGRLMRALGNLYQTVDGNWGTSRRC